MSRQTIAAHYARLLSRWPKDILRPERPFNKVLQQRAQNPPVPFRPEEKEVNAAYLLLDNTFSKQFPLQDKLLRPQSDPDYYVNLKKELLELPNRSWLQNFVKRMKNMVRLK